MVGGARGINAGPPLCPVGEGTAAASFVSCRSAREPSGAGDGCFLDLVGAGRAFSVGSWVAAIGGTPTTMSRVISDDRDRDPQLMAASLSHPKFAHTAGGARPSIAVAGVAATQDSVSVRLASNSAA